MRGVSRTEHFETGKSINFKSSKETLLRLAMIVCARKYLPFHWQGPKLSASIDYGIHQDEGTHVEWTGGFYLFHFTMTFLNIRSFKLTWCSMLSIYWCRSFLSLGALKWKTFFRVKYARPFFLRSNAFKIETRFTERNSPHGDQWLKHGVFQTTLH